MTNEELFAKAQNGDIEARNKLLESHYWIATQIYLKLKKTRNDKDTIFYGATLGLIHAIKTFDIKKGNFKSYAYICAYRTAQTEMSKDWIVRVPMYKLHKTMRSGELPYTVCYLGNAEEVEETNKDDWTPGEMFYYDSYQDKDLHKIIKEVINELKPLEKDAILYMWANTGETLQSLKKKHGVSHEWVRQTIFRTLEKFKNRVLRKIKEQYEF